MKIFTLPDGDVIHHFKKAIVLIFAGKRHVLSTGPNNGGYREDLMAVFNHDANPGAGMACVMRDETYEGHMNVVALEDLGLDPEKCSGLCTAASMENASVKSLTYEELTVTAIATAGIDHNGGRVGDPASYYEKNGRFLSVEEENETAGTQPGTINVILHISADLDGGTLARTIMTASEAKAAALQELRVRSHHSSGLATGSGTDGIICVCNPGSRLRLTNAGKNSKLGELIGKTVKAAVREALFKQTGLCADRQRDVIRILDRYGVDEDRLWEIYLEGSADMHAGEGRGKLLKADFIDRLDSVKKEEENVERAFLFAHVLDLLSWGLISQKEASHMSAAIFDRKEENTESGNLIRTYMDGLIEDIGRTIDGR